LNANVKSGLGYIRLMIPAKMNKLSSVADPEIRNRGSGRVGLGSGEGLCLLRKKI